MSDKVHGLPAQISRRKIVRDLSIGVASAAVAGASLAEPKSVTKSPPAADWAREVDVIIVGSGAAAFAAAVTARLQGVSVLMLEKAGVAGGTTARSGGGVWLPNNPDLRAAGRPDDRAAAIDYMARASYPNLYTPGHATLGLPRHQYELIAAFFDHDVWLHRG